MLPRLFDILPPSSAMMWPRQMTVLEARLVEEQRADRVQRVEPAARLIHRLADVVGRELLGEDLAVLERIVPLRHRHRAGVEPAVGHFLDAAHRAAALRGRATSARPRPAGADRAARRPAGRGSGHWPLCCARYFGCMKLRPVLAFSSATEPTHSL